MSLFCLGAAAGETSNDSFRRLIDKALNASAQRDYIRAEGILEDAVAKATDERRSTWEATFLSFLGSVYQKDGRYAEAETVLNRAISQWTRLEGPNGRDLVGPLGNLGGLYYEAGQYSLAEKNLSRAIEVQLAFMPKAAGLLATLMNNLGDVYYAEHKDDLARQTAERALRRYQLTDDRQAGSASAWSLLGAVYIREHKLPEGETCLRQALTIWQSLLGPEDPHTGEGLVNLATFYSVSGESLKAEPLYERADTIFAKSGGDRTFIQHFLGEYADLERRLGHKKKAKLLAKKVERMASTSASQTVARDIVDVSSLQSGK